MFRLLDSVVVLKLPSPEHDKYRFRIGFKSIQPDTNGLLFMPLLVVFFNVLFIDLRLVLEDVISLSVNTLNFPDARDDVNEILKVVVAHTFAVEAREAILDVGGI